MNRLHKILFHVDEWNWVTILIQSVKLLVWIGRRVNKKK